MQRSGVFVVVDGVLKGIKSMTLRGPIAAIILWMLCAAAHAGNVTYIYTDPQGTPLVEADAVGNVTATFDYSPYGSQALGSAPANAGYTGHVDDPETGVIYMQARYYDPSIARFLSTDPIGPNAGNVFNLNRFAYVNDNPISNIDPTGACVGNHHDFDDPCNPEPIAHPPPPPVGPAVQRMRDSSDRIGGTSNQGGLAAYQAAAATAAAINLRDFMFKMFTSWNGSIGVGVAGSLMPDQGSMDVGVAADTSGKVCFYINPCVGATVTNPPLWGAYGGVGGVGHGMLPESRSVILTGVVYNAGETIMGDGAIMRDNEGSITVARGFLGQVVSPYADAVYGGGMQICRTRYYGCQ